MGSNLDTLFENNRENLKTFKEIKNALRELLSDTEKENRTIEQTKIIQESKQKVENNIIENLHEGLKILSGDYLYPLKYLTTYKTIFTFQEKAKKIFPGDILKLEGNDLIIVRENKKIKIGTIYKIEEIKTKKTDKKISYNNSIEVNELAEKIKKLENHEEKNSVFKEFTEKNISEINKLIPNNSNYSSKDFIKLFSKYLITKENNSKINEKLLIKIVELQNIKDGIIGDETIDQFILKNNIAFSDIKMFLNTEEQNDYLNIINGKMKNKYSDNINLILKKITNNLFYKRTIPEIILISTLKKTEI